MDEGRNPLHLPPGGQKTPHSAPTHNPFSSCTHTPLSLPHTFVCQKEDKVGAHHPRPISRCECSADTIARHNIEPILVLEDMLDIIHGLCDEMLIKRYLQVLGSRLVHFVCKGKMCPGSSGASLQLKEMLNKCDQSRFQWQGSYQ